MKAAFAGLNRLRAGFRNRIHGLLFGISIGDALGFPLNDTPPGGILEINGENINFIDTLHFSDVGFRDTWPIETTLALNTCKALIELYEDTRPLKKTLSSPLMKQIFLKYVSDETDRVIVSKNSEKILYRLNNHDSLFTKLAPIAPFASRCGMDLQQTLEFSCRVSQLSTKAFSSIFPALEYVLMLKSIFGDEKEIPDTLRDIGEWATHSGLEDEFKKYESIHHRPLDSTPSASETWLWKNVINSILGLNAGENWADIQAFENPVLKAVNSSFFRSRAGAVVGGMLGSYWGYQKIPLKFRSNIRGDNYLFSGGEKFTEGLFSMRYGGRIKQFNDIEKTKQNSAKPKPATANIRPSLIYTASNQLSCVFYSVIVKNDVLDSKYSGGLNAYAQKHGAICNEDISVVCDMGSDINLIIKDLITNGLKSGHDYHLFDATAWDMSIAHEKINTADVVSIPLDVEWLGAQFTSDKGVLVWYKENKKKA